MKFRPSMTMKNEHNHNLLSDLLTPEQQSQRRFLLESATDGSWGPASQQLGLDGEFNEPWMDNINSGLLYRYWVKKGMPKPLIVKHSGIKIRLTGTPLGIIKSIEKPPMFSEEPYRPTPITRPK